MPKLTTKARTTRTVSVAAPVGGLNARDAIANMEPTDAIMIENWFPNTSGCDVRNGYTNWATGMSGWVETVMAYNGVSTKSLFAAANNSIYDVTAGGAVGAAVVSAGITSNRWQHVNISTAGGKYLYAFNGADKPLLYDGATWTRIDGVSVPAITGVTTTNLDSPQIFKSRLWMVEKNTLKIWYLPVNSVGGAATSIDFTSLFRLGGYLMGMVTWTLNNSAGVDDYAAFVTSEGEIALYKGTDPSSSTTWALVGTFRIGRPIGKRFYNKMGSDVVMLTADGVVTISKSFLTDRSNLSDVLSAKIGRAVNSDVQDFNANFGWQPILYPIGNKLIINVPQSENSYQYQYVCNTITGAWTVFTGWKAACWETQSDALYFGGNGVVCRADYGTKDNGNSITAKVKPAFQYFGNATAQKRFTMIRPIFSSSGGITAAIKLNTDFQDSPPTSVPTYSGVNGTQWDAGYWDTFQWAGDTQISKRWLTSGGIGYSATINMQVIANGISVNWQSIDYVFEQGGTL